MECVVEEVQEAIYLMGVSALFILMLGGAGAFLLKPDSALGRLFLWKITCRAVVNYLSLIHISEPTRRS